MIVFKKRVKFSGSKAGENTFISDINNRMYSDRELKSGGHFWIKKTQKFKDRVKTGIIVASGEVVKNLDSDLVKVATELGINFDDDIQQSKLEEMVKAKQEDDAEKADAKKDDTPKVDTKKADAPETTTPDAELEEKRAILTKILALNFNGAKVTWKLQTLKNKLAELEAK